MIPDETIIRYTNHAPSVVHLEPAGVDISDRRSGEKPSTIGRHGCRVMTFRPEVCLGINTVLDSGWEKLECVRFLVFNINLTFLYNIDIEGFEMFQQKIKLPSMRFELTTAAISGLEF